MDEEVSDFERIASLVRDAFADHTVEWGLFRTAESEHGSVRRVVWIPTEFTCEAPEKTQQDVLHTDFVTVECQVSGQTFADACQIRKQVCSAVRRVMGTASEAADGIYQTEQYGAAGIMWGGHSKIIQRFVWRLNVLRLPERTGVPIKEIDLQAKPDVPIVVDPPVLRLDEELALTTDE